MLRDQSRCRTPSGVCCQQTLDFLLGLKPSFRLTQLRKEKLKTKIENTEELRAKSREAEKPSTNRTPPLALLWSLRSKRLWLKVDTGMGLGPHCLAIRPAVVCPNGNANALALPTYPFNPFLLCQLCLPVHLRGMGKGACATLFVHSIYTRLFPAPCLLAYHCTRPNRKTFSKFSLFTTISLVAFPLILH